MGIGMDELIIILIIVLILFGANRLPEIGASLGKAITNFKKAVRDAESEHKKADQRENASSATQIGQNK